MIQMGNYAIVNEETGKVLNVIVWDGNAGWVPPDGHFTLELASDANVSPGDNYKDGVFSRPPAPPPTAEEIEEQKRNLIAGNLSKKQSLLAEATQTLGILQDAVDLDMATDEEARLLPLWKKYRVLLSRVDVSAAIEIEWPAKPA